MARRLKFKVSHLLILTAIFAVAFVSLSVPCQNWLTIRKYNFQRSFTELAVQEIGDEFKVKYGSQNVSTECTNGSGEWHIDAVLTTVNASGSDEKIQYLNVIGAVSHTTTGLPNWKHNSPIRIQYSDSDIGKFYCESLASKYLLRRWPYTTEEYVFAEEPVTKLPKPLNGEYEELLNSMKIHRRESFSPEQFNVIVTKEEEE